MARRPTDPEWNTLHTWFPLLIRANVWVIGEATGVYNCLAWALGITDRWIWPWGPFEPDLPEFDRWLAQHGYAVGSPAAAASYGAPKAIGHIARYLATSPTSKLGSYLLITHTWLDIAPGAYGNLQQFYRRTVPADDQQVKPEEMDVPIRARELPALTRDEAQRLKRITGLVSADAKREFESAWEAWRKTLHDPRIALDSSFGQAARNSEFIRLVVAARSALPLLVERLLDPTEPRVLAVAEQVLPPAQIVRFAPDDPEVLEGEQYRARLIAANILSGSHLAG